MTSPLKPEVRAQFVPFTVRFEGKIPWMYLDVRGLVTIAIGILCDHVGAALSLPLVHEADGYPASNDEIALAWHTVKDRQDLARLGASAFRPLTDLRLTDEGVENVVLAKLDEMAGALAERFPAFASWPWQAQLGVLSVAWAVGPWFLFPRFEAALRAQDWATCAVECHLNENGNPGLHARNQATVALFNEAVGGT